MNFFKCLSGKAKANDRTSSKNKNAPIVQKGGTHLVPPNKLRINSDLDD